MDKPRKIENFNSTEVLKFINSFDTILTDCDGVLWVGQTPLKGSLETLTRLQSLGKKIIFISNNSTQTVETMSEKIRKMGYPASTDQIALPSNVICWYLKKLGFTGKAFVLGMNTFRQVLKDEGIDVLEPGPNVLEERVETVMSNILDIPEADAVVVDFDININWAKISRAIRYLKKNKVLYLTGALDRKVLISERVTFLGMPDFVDTISRESNKEPVQCAKPSEAMRDYVLERFDLADPSRCLFIGDSLDSDMKFAELCGFGKLWVGTGVSTLEEASSNMDSPALESDSSISYYYLPRLGLLKDILDKTIV